MRSSPRRRVTSRLLDSWFPICVRYAGLGLILYAAWTRQAALATTAVGMIFFKTIVGNGKE